MTPARLPSPSPGHGDTPTTSEPLPFRVAGGGRALPRIYLCGPIAEPGKPARGGFQACNRRTVDALVARGLDVVALAYPEPQTHSVRKLIDYFAGFARLASGVVSCRRSSIFHMTGVHGRLVYAELVLILLARLRGCRCIYDVRAGSAPTHYRRRGPLFRLSFRAALRRTDLLLVEGEELVEFVESVTGRTPAVFPNHVDPNAIPPRPDFPLASLPVVAYAGAVRPEKGVRTLLEACRLLGRAGLPVEVRVAGTGAEPFVDELRDDYEDLGVAWEGAIGSGDVLAMFGGAHFFLFPTSHVGEGQSNALTEAMACGCVPIASEHGFNVSVIGDCGRLLPPQARASDYADALQAIWSSGSWGSLSQRARQRIRDRFSSPRVIDGLIAHYRQVSVR